MPESPVIWRLFKMVCHQSNETMILKEAGVGMALSSRAKKYLVDWEPINERILRARFATSQAKLTVIVVYAPTNDTVDQTKDDFYRVLSNVVAKAHRHDIVTWCGDFNAKVGSDAFYAPAILGRHGLGEINDNGNESLKPIKDSDYYVLEYDETTNISIRKELHVCIRYFSRQQDKVVSRHLETSLSGKATIEKLKEGLLKAVNKAGLQLQHLSTLPEEIRVDRLTEKPRCRKGSLGHGHKQPAGSE
ncbi:hypothetical protein QYM36_018899 [Artemia franciscana]|uniref:Craniofacial development protein 2-like n=1 Tax=Artemia franciscana TaxID=6661 RepID=A0AA88KTI3_ARTSF|nr:hypothetical protein QYM36_018899 [Artemia franciscana]